MSSLTAAARAEGSRGPSYAAAPLPRGPPLKLVGGDR